MSDWTVSRLADVAEFFDKSLPEIQRWRRLGMPGKQRAWPVDEIFRWRLAALTAAGREIADDSAEEAERQLAWTKVRAQRVRLAAARGELVLTDEVMRDESNAVSAHRTLLEQTPDRLRGMLPPGVTGEQLRAFRAGAVAIIDRYIDQLREFVSERARVIEQESREQEERDNAEYV